MTNSNNNQYQYWVVTMTEQPKGNPIYKGEYINYSGSKSDIIQEYLNNNILVVNIIDL